jgi:hypothetical protein
LQEALNKTSISIAASSGGWCSGTRHNVGRRRHHRNIGRPSSGKMGVKDVLLLERDQLTSGTTWHAVGLMNTFWEFVHDVDQHETIHTTLKDILLAETGLETGFMDIGFYRNGL